MLERMSYTPTLKAVNSLHFPKDLQKASWMYYSCNLSKRPLGGVGTLVWLPMGCGAALELHFVLSFLNIWLLGIIV